MGKTKILYECKNCEYQSHQWVGRCPQCKEWNSFEEKENLAVKKNQKKSSLQEQKVQSIVEVTGEEDLSRLQTGFSELDRLLGGGIVHGSLILLGGEPGIGKTTLLMEIMGNLLKGSHLAKLLYVSGEESLSQLKNRAQRLNVDHENFYAFHQTQWEKIAVEIRNLKPDILVLDSIQTIYSGDSQSSPGTASQIKEVTFQVLELVKSLGIPCFLIGHVTKEGVLAGPKILEHMVDVVIYFEGDEFGHYRMLRANKNRYGETQDLALFEMQEKGLSQVSNPARFFLNETSEKESMGRACTAILEGSRVLFVEIQALTLVNKFGNARRTTQGHDSNRLAMLLAVIEKYLDIPLLTQDVYLNIVGGLKLKGRESDLAVVVAILSSYLKREISQDYFFIGEIGLSGEIRSIPRIEQRVKELERFSVKKVFLPPVEIDSPGVAVEHFANITDFFQSFFQQN